MQVKLGLVPLILLLAVFAAGDNKLSAEFQLPARSYLQTLHECSDRALQKEEPPPCFDNDISKKAQDAAATPADKAVYKTLSSWDGTLAEYAL